MRPKRHAIICDWYCYELLTINSPTLPTLSNPLPPTSLSSYSTLFLPPPSSFPLLLAYTSSTSAFLPLQILSGWLLKIQEYSLHKTPLPSDAPHHLCSLRQGRECSTSLSSGWWTALTTPLMTLSTSPYCRSVHYQQWPKCYCTPSMYTLFITAAFMVHIDLYKICVRPALIQASYMLQCTVRYSQSIS